MKSIVRLGLTLSLLGGTVFGPSLIQTPAAFAMPEADALKRLEPIPVFTLTNAQGIPILASVADPKNKAKQLQIATFFMSQQDAQSLLTTLKTQKPDLGKDAKILSLSMRQAYDIKLKNKSKADTLLFEFLPPKQQVDAAIAVLKQNGQNVKDFPDIPLFFAIGGADKGLLTIEQGKEKVIPFYFNQQDLQGMLDQLKQRDPKLSSTTKIQVTSLSKVVDSLMKENSAGIQQITLVPDRAALQYALQQGGKGTAKPGAAAPAAPGKSGAVAPTRPGAVAPAAPVRPATTAPAPKSK
jgi:Tic22-like family